MDLGPRLEALADAVLRSIPKPVDLGPRLDALAEAVRTSKDAQLAQKLD